MAALFTKNKAIVFVGLILVIFIAFASIALTNGFLSSNNTFSNTNALKGYVQLRTKLNALGLTNNTLYAPLLAQFSIVENIGSTPASKYQALAQAAFLLSDVYTRNQNPQVYKFIVSDLSTFAKDNFKNYYKQADFAVTCDDSSCADSPQPKEILSVIVEINSLTTVSQGNKQGTITNLKNDMYFPSANASSKASAYLYTAYLIRNDKEFTDAGVNNKIADEIEVFAKQAYPNDYDRLRAAINRPKS